MRDEESDCPQFLENNNTRFSTPPGRSGGRGRLTIQAGYMGVRMRWA